MGPKYIAVVDCGGQTAHLICRRLRDYGFLAWIVSAGQEQDLIQDPKLVGIIISGSPASVVDGQQLELLAAILRLGVPILGICYGLHWLCRSLGGEVGKLARAEYGPQKIALSAAGRQHPLLESLPSQLTTWMSHGDSLAQLPHDFVELARSEHQLPAVVAHRQRPIFGVQFHPETSHCEGGEPLLRNFAANICQMEANWQANQQFEQLQQHWRDKIDTQKVVLLISGGVDSAVVAAFLLRIMPAEQLYLLHFDTGLMRLGEGDQVMDSLEHLGAKNVYRLNVAEQFLAALSGVSEPEDKRRRIGNLFIEIQQQFISSTFSDDYLLAQGTLYTDMIESGHSSGHSQTIKSHHNVGTPLVAALRAQGRLVEPLADLYKDEVRRLGLMLGLAEQLVYRHPFPGPGLAIRILGEVTAEKVALLQRVDHIFLEQLHQLQLYDKIWQAFAVLLPVASVGVTGDARHYGAVVALRAVSASDGMSAEAYPFSAAELRQLVNAICSQVKEVSRVVYDVTAKPPATIEWE